MKIQTLNLENQPIRRLLFNMSLPAIIGMMVHGMYNIVDTMFIGKSVGSLGVAGLTIAFPIQMFIMSLAQIVGLGGASAISRSLGAKNSERANHVAGNVYVLILFISMFVMIFGINFIDEILLSFGTNEAILPYAKEYTEVILMGVLFITFSAAVADLIRSEGNAKVAMVTMLCGTVTNIVLDPILIFGFDMGMRGAAIATVISQAFTFCLILFYLIKGNSSLQIRAFHLRPDFTIIKEIVAVGTPAFFRSVGGSLMFIVINHSLIAFGGTLAVAAFGIVNRVMMFLFMPILGTIQGMQPIVAYNYGAGNFKRIQETIKLAIFVTAVIGLICLLFGELFPGLIVMVFTKVGEREAMNQVAIPAIRIILISSPIIGAAIISGSAFESFGKARPAMFFTLLRQIILLIPFVLIFPRLFGSGLYGVWTAFPLADILSAAISILILKRELSNQAQTVFPVLKTS
ncbi:MATE family efflux transporter [bacterium]|nr:MATE family efflux transporter [bacterium]